TGVGETDDPGSIGLQGYKRGARYLDTALRVKTTRRSVYEAARAEYRPDEADEVILLNERGEVCEGNITSIFLDDGTGILRTPPISCGLLA
ncbi:aminotransferase class IV, partial [Rhizobium ruizarguesonis]